jgi:hypothetical protein
MAISNDLLSSTLRILVDREVDNLFVAVPLFNNIRSHGGVETYDGGTKIDRPLILADHSQITQLSTGYEPVNLAVSDVLRHASFNWCDYVAPIVITKKEELSNRGDRAIIKIAEARLKAVMGMLQREFEKQIIANSSTVLTELNTLNGVPGASGSAGTGANEGFLDRTNPSAGLVGALSKTTFTEFNNQVKQGNNFGTDSNAVDQLTELYIDCQNHSPIGTPNLIMASPASYRHYKQALFDNTRYMPEDAQDGGKLALAFAGAKMYANPFLPLNAGGVADEVSMYMLNTEFLKMVFDSDANFSLGEFETVTGYASRSANIMTRCQLVTDHLASQGLLTNAES